MKALETFSEILATKTRDGFHDASLLSLAIELERHVLELRIEHARGDSNGEERWIVSALRFGGVADLKVERVGEVWGMSSAPAGDEISSFGALDAHGRAAFELLGIQGWRVSFTASGVEYSETPSHQ